MGQRFPGPWGDRAGRRGGAARWRIAGSGIKRPDGSWLLYEPPAVVQKRWGAGFATVHRAELQRLLAGQLNTSAIHLGARCTGFRDTQDVARARFEDGGKVEADLLVGADGAHSVVRATLLGPLRFGIAVTPRWEDSRPQDLSRFPATRARPGAEASASASRPPVASGWSGTRSGKPRRGPTMRAEALSTCSGFSVTGTSRSGRSSRRPPLTRLSVGTSTTACRPGRGPEAGLR
jgi:hypothetical protein